MSLSVHKIIKWTNMILGNSSYHVNQNEGKCYSIDDIKGYYNNLTEKITRFGEDGISLPITKHDNGSSGYFSIAIFQYGLAAYDLWLMTNESRMHSIFYKCVEWAIENQDVNGAWKTFHLQNANEPYSAMAQGEGISLLSRAYIDSGNETYKSASCRAVKFLLKDKKDGGVAEFIDNKIFLYEFTYLPLVLNGWIFAAWGLLDYYKISGDNQIREYWNNTVDTIAETLSLYDAGYWSFYNLNHNIASSFYHNLHIAQLDVMYSLTGNVTFKFFSDKWKKFNKNPVYKSIAFLNKVYQKLIEK